MDGMGGGMMGMGSWMVLWGLLGLALLVLVVVAIVWLIRNLMSGSRRTTDSAEDKLRHRYASGELSHEEYRQRLAELRGD